MTNAQSARNAAASVSVGVPSILDHSSFHTSLHHNKGETQENDVEVQWAVGGMGVGGHIATGPTSCACACTEAMLTQDPNT